jgi:hypothetical protein
LSLKFLPYLMMFAFGVTATVVVRSISKVRTRQETLLYYLFLELLCQLNIFFVLCLPIIFFLEMF